MPIAVTPKIALCLREITMATIASRMLMCVRVSQQAQSSQKECHHIHGSFLPLPMAESLSFIRHFWVDSNNSSKKIYSVSKRQFDGLSLWAFMNCVSNRREWMESYEQPQVSVVASKESRAVWVALRPGCSRDVLLNTGWMFPLFFYFQELADGMLKHWLLLLNISALEIWGKTKLWLIWSFQNSSLITSLFSFSSILHHPH